MHLMTCKMKLEERFQAERSDLLHTGLNSETKRNVIGHPKRLGDYETIEIKRDATEDDELVRYMSNLPSYLKRGEKIKGNAFSVGVLDWRRLEKWHMHKQLLHRSSRNSTSSSSASSPFSAEASSSHSSRGRSCSPVHQRMHRPVIKCHLANFPSEMDGHLNKMGGEGSSKVRDPNPMVNKDFEEHYKIQGAGQPLMVPLESKMEECKRKNQPDFQKGGIFPSPDGAEVIYCSKGKTNIHEGASRNNTDKCQKLISGIPEQDVTQKTSPIAIHQPREACDRHSEASQISDSLVNLKGNLMEAMAMSKPFCAAASNQRSSEASQQKVPQKTRGVHLERFCSDVPRSCTLHHGSICRIQSQVKQPASRDAVTAVLSSDTLHPYSGSPYRNTGVEIRNSKIKAVDNAQVSPKGSDQKDDNLISQKARSSSPFHRLSISIGKMSKNHSSKDDVTVPSVCLTKSSSDKANLPSSHKSRSINKQNSASRSRSSPLRRLLDPIMKPRASNSSHSDEASQRGSVPWDRVYKSSNGRSDSTTSNPVKVNLDFTNCKKIDIKDSPLEKRPEPSTKQALLRVAFKNGLPLFTFAVDNESDVLAATVKKSTSSKEDTFCWLYTFFAISEVRKKSGNRINQGGKSKGQDYIPNFMAQMRVSDFFSSKSTPQHCSGQFRLREYVVLAVDPRTQDQQTMDFQPNNELAAIVAQIPATERPSIFEDRRHDGLSINFSAVREKGYCQDPTSYNEGNQKDQTYNDGGHLISTTVILPSGVHSIPSKGGPSSLIERWVAGGSCDCGGWDLGCQLKILAGQNSFGLTPSKAKSPVDQFSLFSQVDMQDNQPVFVLSPFKEGIFSVDFSSLISTLQAFAVSISVLETKNLIENWGDSHLSKEKLSSETVVPMQVEGTEVSSQPEGAAPVKYVSFPPLSPVGRV